MDDARGDAPGSDQIPDQAGALLDVDPTREHQLAHHPSAAEPVLMEGGIAVVDHPAAVERLALEPAPIAPALTVVVAPSVIAAPAGIAPALTVVVAPSVIVVLSGIAATSVLLRVEHGRVFGRLESVAFVLPQGRSAQRGAGRARDHPEHQVHSFHRAFLRKPWGPRGRPALSARAFQARAPLPAPVL